MNYKLFFRTLIFYSQIRIIVNVSRTVTLEKSDSVPEVTLHCRSKYHKFIPDTL